MKLSAERFYDLLASLKPGACCSLDELRTEPRIEFVGHGKITIGAESQSGEPMAVGVRDLSRAGIGIIHMQPIPIGQEFSLRLPTDEDPDNRITYRVIRCTRVGDKLYNIGGRLMSDAAVLR